MIYQRITESKENIIDLVKNGKVDVLVRLANCSNNWTSQLDKQLAKAFPDFELADNNSKLGEYNSHNKRIENLFFVGNKIVSFVNAYIYKDKDERGRYIFDRDSFFKIIKELDENNKGRIICFDLKQETTINKDNIINKLNSILKFSKVIITL